MFSAVIMAAAVGLLVSALLGFVIIPWLRRLHVGQTIKEIGPVWHMKKQNTPTMGGFLFIIGSAVGLAVGLVLYGAASHKVLEISAQQYVRLFAGFAAALLYGATGFIDDYLKVIKHDNAGLRGWYKVFCQVFVSAAYLFVIHRWGGASTAVELPLIGTVDFGVFYFFIAIFMMVGFVNAANLTDGLDGLCGSVTFVITVFLIPISYMLGEFGFTLLSAASSGAILGFLVWNFYPAKVFMGDTGSMFLGGLFVSAAFGINRPVFVIIMGMLYLIEAVSVMLQVAYFKLTHGKRLFKMTPIHHHFEKCGYSEVKIVGLFSAFTAVMCVLALLCVK